MFSRVQRLLHHGEDHVDLSDHGYGWGHTQPTGTLHEDGHGGGGYHSSFTTGLTYTLDGNGTLRCMLMQQAVRETTSRRLRPVHQQKRAGHVPGDFHDAADLSARRLGLQEEEGPGAERVAKRPGATHPVHPGRGGRSKHWCEKKADRYLPFLLTTFFFIFLCNLLGTGSFHRGVQCDGNGGGDT